MCTDCELEARVDIGTLCASMRQKIRRGDTQVTNLALETGCFVFERADSSRTTFVTTSWVDEIELFDNEFKF